MTRKLSLTRRQVVQGGARVDNVGILGLIAHLTPFDAVGDDGVEGILPG